jgi:hypothetical protein
VLILGATAFLTTAVLPQVSTGAGSDPANLALPAPNAPDVGRRTPAGSPAPAVQPSPRPSMPGIVVVVAPPMPDTPRRTPTADPTTQVPDVVVATAPPPPGPAFAPLVYEAEDVPSSAQSRTDQVDLYDPSGPDGVHFTRPWGWIEFRSLGVTVAGTYRITVVYAPDEDRRELELRGDDASIDFDLASGSGCCATVGVEVSLSPGGTIRIEPDGWWLSRRPAIDRIIIDQR